MFHTTNQMNIVDLWAWLKLDIRTSWHRKYGYSLLDHAEYDLETRNHQIWGYRAIKKSLVLFGLYHCPVELLLKVFSMTITRKWTCWFPVKKRMWNWFHFQDLWLNDCSHRFHWRCLKIKNLRILLCIYHHDIISPLQRDGETHQFWDIPIQLM